MMTIPTVAEITANSDALKAMWCRGIGDSRWVERQRQHEQTEWSRAQMRWKMRHRLRYKTKMLWFEQRADGSV